MEGDDIAPRRFKLFDIEGRVANTLQMLGERSRNRLPLSLTIRKRLLRGESAVVRAEQRPQVPTCHTNPRSDQTRRNLRLPGVIANSIPDCSG
ncbi:hypothetical protein ACFU7T_35065 [Streptomyces sp. NPDC057555]|uniref:hypothetical protein n=1 Tax=Streptomyces sp. NPDC057555 TaxID=3346166 RepID=UPI003697251E